MTPENEVKRAILEYLLYNHWLVLRINSGGVTGGMFTSFYETGARAREP